MPRPRRAALLASSAGRPPRRRVSAAATAPESAEPQASGGAPRRRRSPDEARRLILEAAQRLLAVHGPDSIGLKDVAREAGVSHALVSHYFGTYDALVEEAFRAHLLTQRAETLARVADLASSGPPEWIDICFDQIAHPLSARMIAWAILSGRIESKDFFPAKEQGSRAVADAIEERVKSELSPGVQPPSREDVELGLLLVFSAALGYSISRNVLWASLGREPDAEHDQWFRERLTAIVTDALPGAKEIGRRKRKGR